MRRSLQSLVLLHVLSNTCATRGARHLQSRGAVVRAGRVRVVWLLGSHILSFRFSECVNTLGTHIHRRYSGCCASHLQLTNQRLRSSLLLLFCMCAELRLQSFARLPGSPSSAVFPRPFLLPSVPFQVHASRLLVFSTNSGGIVIMCSPDSCKLIDVNR